MAYLTKDGKEPYPNKAGEYCGNHFPGSPPVLSIYQSPKEAIEQQERYLERMRFGRPHSCQAGTSDQMFSKDWVGLYLKEDSPHILFDGQIEVPTPPELMEPVHPAK
jgi:hypothetical protein